MTDDHGVVDVSECRGETPLAARRKVYWRTHKHLATHKSSIEKRVCHGRIHLQKKKLWAPFRMACGGEPTLVGARRSRVGELDVATSGIQTIPADKCKRQPSITHQSDSSEVATPFTTPTLTNQRRYSRTTAHAKRLMGLAHIRSSSARQSVKYQTAS